MQRRAQGRAAAVTEAKLKWGCGRNEVWKNLHLFHTFCGPDFYVLSLRIPEYTINLLFGLLSQKFLCGPTE